MVALKSECIMWPGRRERGERDKYKGPILGIGNVHTQCQRRHHYYPQLASSADTRIQFPFASPLSGSNVILFSPLISLKWCSGTETDLFNV